VTSLLLLAPALTQDVQLRRRLAIPMLLLVAFLLNPWLAPLISHYLMTPPVYWRVIWALPVLAYASTAIHNAIVSTLEDPSPKNPAPWVLATFIVMLAFASPYNGLRAQNGITWAFATPKVDQHNYLVAEQAIRVTDGAHRILAPDEISSVIAMFERHPPLVGVRSMYLYMLRESIPESAYASRSRLQASVNGEQYSDKTQVWDDLLRLNVQTVVTKVRATGADDLCAQLAAGGYRISTRGDSYLIWSRLTPPDSPER
jgi:hypothetical protein